MKIGELSLAQVTRRLRGDGLCFRTGPFATHLRSRLPDVAHALHHLYADFSLEQPGGFYDFHVRLDRPRGLRRWYRPQSRFFFDGFQPFMPFPRRLAVPLMEWGLNWCVASQCHQYLILHAAVIARDDRAMILPAPPGSGKSTLCAGLVMRGWRLLSDELTLIRPETGWITPLPRPINLKEGSIRVIRDWAPQAVFGPVWKDTRKGTVAHLRPPRASVEQAHRPALPAWVVLPRWTPQGPARIEPISKAAMMMRLLDNAFNDEAHGEAGFDAFTRLLDRCDCFALTYSKLEDAAELFERLPVPEQVEEAADARLAMAE